MDFFERQEKARRNTKWLVLYFAGGVAGLIVALYLATLVAFAGVHSRHHDYGGPGISLWNARLFAGVALGTLAIIGIGSASKTMELAQGGSAVANMMGGRIVRSNSTDPAERKLLNVVEEMALASGVPVPPV